MNTKRKAAPKPPKVTYRQEDGDDGFCYCVRVDGRAVTHASLTRQEAMHEKARILAAWAAKSAAIAIVFLACISVARAEPNPDVEAYCRSTATSYVAMRNCVEAERKARNEQSCLDALATWPKDQPCPAAWFQQAIANIRAGLPCQMAEVRQ